MRKALNENPMVQLAVLGVGGIVLAVMLVTTLSGGSSSSTDTPPADPAAATTAVVDPATPATTASATAPPPAAAADPAATATAPATATATPPPTTATDPGSADGLLPSAGLPKDVLVAYAKNQAIALLVIDPKAVADKQVEKESAVLKSRDDVEYFMVKSKDIADYARITQGVSVSRTPSLVVIRPRDKTTGAPTAIVAEGYLSPESINTAVEDALYDGKDVPSYPE